MQPAILTIEDNRLVLHMVKDTLKLEGWLVSCREDGYTALRLIKWGCRAWLASAG
jgi:DNA-binding response OmpR family regulator